MLSLREVIIQQDVAPSDTAKSAQVRCNTALLAFIYKEEWSAPSPDLRPLDLAIWGNKGQSVCYSTPKYGLVEESPC